MKDVKRPGGAHAVAALDDRPGPRQLPSRRRRCARDSFQDKTVPGDRVLAAGLGGERMRCDAMRRAESERGRGGRAAGRSLASERVFGDDVVPEERPALHDRVLERDGVGARLLTASRRRGGCRRRDGSMMGPRSGIGERSFFLVTGEPTLLLEGPETVLIQSSIDEESADTRDPTPRPSAQG